MSHSTMKIIAAPAKPRHKPRLAHGALTEATLSLGTAGFRLGAAALAIAAAFMASPGAAVAQPAGAQVIHGQASMVQQGNSLAIMTQNGGGTNHSAINWQSFSVPAGSTTQFNQPNAASTSINRVLGNNPSAIFGTLSSNGRLVLVNPSGIAVGAGAVVDTAGFTASTLRMSDADALAGRLVFGGDGLGGGPLAVEGRILARNGDVVLIAPDVQVGSQALVQAPNGATLLAAGQKVELTGRGLEGIRLELQAPGDQAVNLGTLQGDAVGIFAGQLKHSGLIQASAASAGGGKVVLKAAGGDSLVDGRIAAVGAAGQGGSIDVLGQRVGLLAGAALDASGESGGGQIRVGGDFQGKNADVMNARRTYVDASATLKADATVNGDGGRIIVWADDQTQSFGAISARGGAQGGDGGFVEVSGKQRLQFESTVDTRAPMGQTGTLLLDPTDIVVAASPAPNSYDTPILFDDVLATLTLDVATINNANSSVILEASNDINIDTDITMRNAGFGFSAKAGGFLNVNGNITTQGGDVELVAGAPGSLTSPTVGALILNGAIVTTAGKATAGAKVALSSGLFDPATGKSVYIVAPIDAGTAGAVSISGQEVYVLNSAVRGGSIGIAANPAGSIYLSGASLSAAGGGISLTSDFGGVSVDNSSLNTAGGDVNLAGGSSVYLNAATVETAGGNIAIKGGNLSSEVAGVYIGGTSHVHAGTGAVNIAGESGFSSGFVFELGGGLILAGPAATISGSDVSIQGTTGGYGSAALRIDSELVSATTAINLRAINGDLQIASSTIENSGPGGMILEALSLPAPAAPPASLPPAIFIDGLSVVKNTGSAAGQIGLSADSIYLDGQINSGLARTMFTPVTTNRAISLGGLDETGKLNLTEAELNNVTAGVIVVGGGSYTGGLTIDGPVNVTSSGALSLIQGASAGISQGKGASLAVGQLNADAGSVSLVEANAVQVLSGRATSASGTGFVFSNGGVADLTVGVVDGISGIVSQSSASLSGSGTLQLNNASTAGSLSWSGFTGATVGSGGGMISAGGPIAAEGDVTLAGILAPGGIGGINTMTVAGNLQVMDGATMKFDFNGISHDSIGVSGNVTFPSATSGSSVIADASIQPTAGSYTLISGATTGDLPTLSGSAIRASLAYGSLVLNVAAPPPPPAPAPAPTTTLSALDEIKLMVGDPSLPPPEDLVTTFLTLFTKAAEEQTPDGDPASGNLVDDTQCRR